MTQRAPRNRLTHTETGPYVQLHRFDASATVKYTSTHREEGQFGLLLPCFGYPCRPCLHWCAR